MVAFDGADAAGSRHIYVRDMDDPSGALQIVDRASGFNGMLAQPEFFALDMSVSFDGHAVLFETAGFNPGPPTDNVFLRDLSRQTTTLVSGVRVTRDPWPADAWLDGFSFVGSLSADTGLVTFSSSASEFSPADATGSTDVYVRRLQPHRRWWWRRAHYGLGLLSPRMPLVRQGTASHSTSGGTACPMCQSSESRTSTLPTAEASAASVPASA